MGIQLPDSKKQIEYLKKNIFVFSCTSDYEIKDHWERFDKNGKAVCLKLKINYTNKKDIALEVRKVAYEKELSRLFSLRNNIINKCQLNLNILGWSTFAKFTKIGCFDWEKEIRLCYDNYLASISNLPGMPPSSNPIIYNDNGQSYVELQLKNEHFELSIEEVIIKKNNWQSQLKYFRSSKDLKFNMIS